MGLVEAEMCRRISLCARLTFVHSRAEPAGARWLQSRGSARAESGFREPKVLFFAKRVSDGPASEGVLTRRRKMERCRRRTSNDAGVPSTARIRAFAHSDARRSRSEKGESKTCRRRPFPSMLCVMKWGVERHDPPFGVERSVPAKCEESDERA